MAAIRFAAVIPRLPIRDVPTVARFYTQVLGFRLSAAWPESDPSFLVLDRDDVSLTFMRTEEVAPAQGQRAELYIAVDGVSRLHEELRSRVEIAWGPAVYWHGRREFAVRDPEGYLLIFTEPTTDPPTVTPE